MLGVKVPLKDWKHFNGGLDVKKDATGTHSVYTRWRGNQVEGVGVSGWLWLCALCMCELEGGGDA